MGDDWVVKLASGTGTGTTAEEVKPIRRFECTICCEPLDKPGPPLSSLCFGKLLLSTHLSLAEEQLLMWEFATDPCIKHGDFADKVMTTPCGHLFHSACLREWFFVRRHDRHSRCPLCNQRASYGECLLLHPGVEEAEKRGEDGVVGEHLSEEELLDLHKPLNATEYSDISGASSSYSSEDEEGETEREDDIMEEIQNNAPPRSASNHNRRRVNYRDLVGELSEEEMEDLFGSGDSTNPLHIERNRNMSPTLLIRITQWILWFLHKTNLSHIWTLLITSACLSFLYDMKLEEYYHRMDTFEDDKVDDHMPVPIGYTFCRFMSIVWLCIFVFEFFLCYARKSLM